ncbi:MBL fold metallo-hydrolase [Nakamurella flavida]|uniref:MBL fold metallo-hydrolase n=1 Tax=Nakamurella flavida TaxID=363630 RepID=A0A939C6Y5_9ACTN|nr:MBL fold metallo-hydrolase [Nakamurella flavida]MBM9477617.1 MBL fold metallo-hydrolase [Nakamurella flavida]MDP9779165.1 L-ascorbate metabolism protein UlaG (beta-lactamase superfamily) [Nakamurella flavida]
MRITKYGHSCLQVEVDRANLLIDPGTFSAGFEQLTGLTAVLITHKHPDHLDVDRVLPLLAANPDAVVLAEADSAAVLTEAGARVRTLTEGDSLDPDEIGTSLTVVGREHAVIHRDMPVIGNAGYLVGGRLFHPGDSLVVPDQPVEILALPVSAPWMAVKEAIDYLRAVDPQVAVPIHEKVLAATGMVYGLLQQFAPADTRWLDLDDGQPAEL